MEKIPLKCLLILIYQFSFIFNEEIKGVFNIKCFGDEILLAYTYRLLIFKKPKKESEELFRIIKSKTNSNSYIIESVYIKKKLGVNDNDDLILLEGNDIQYWNIIKINDKEFLIQNNNTKKFLEGIETVSLQNKKHIKCSENITIPNISIECIPKRMMKNKE